MMKRVWILGAGASISHAQGKFPGIDSFFAYAKNFKITMGSQRTVRDEYARLASYVEAVFGKSITRINDRIDVEQLLTFLEIDIQNYDNAETKALHRRVLKLILDVMTRAQNVLGAGAQEYDSFVEHFLGPDDTIITFNWDTMLDDALERRQQLRKDTDFDGTNQYTNFLQEMSATKIGTWSGMAVKPPYAEQLPKVGRYLKMHGSVDWHYCNDPKCRGYAKVFPMVEVDNPFYCSECHSRTQRLMVPPVLNKQYQDLPLMRSIWNTAEVELQEADEIVVWGYSLPPTDFRAARLLRYFPREDETIPFQQRKLQRYTLINPSVVSGKDPKTLGRTYIRHMLYPVRQRVDKENVELYEYFKDFVAGATVQQKYPTIGNLDYV